MKIQKVHIKKFKALKDFEADLHGKNILLMGDNGVGKSSTIQFIEIALGKTSNIPKEAEGEGYVVTDKDGKEFKFSVKFKAGKPVIEVECDGMKDTRKSTIAGLVGAIDFDIDEFVAWSETKPGQKKQVEFFKSLLDGDIQDEIRRHESNLKKIEEDRTETGRSVKALRGFVSEHPMHNKAIITAPVDIETLEAEQTAGIKNNNQRSAVIERCEARDKEIDELQEKLKKLQEQNKEAQKWLTENPEKDLSTVNQRLSEARDINARVEMAKDYHEKRKYLTHDEDLYESLTAQIESTRQLLSDTIKDMDSPIPGLTFNDEMLIYNGVPVAISNMSSSEIIELGVKMKMAENPDLGVLFIQRGESIGKKRFEEILSLCEENGWQLIMEQVERGNEKLTVQIIGEK
jgi:energy-coupling factor transporter ATP-binding protein EcfA2